MLAPQTIATAGLTETRVRRACLVSDCPCKDSRIVSFRRAAFFAAVPRRSAQTADRIVEVEAEWRIPLDGPDGLEPRVEGMAPFGTPQSPSSAAMKRVER